VKAEIPSARSFSIASSTGILRVAAWPAAMPTNSGFGSGAAENHSISASMRSASDREASVVWKTIALMLGRAAS